MHKNLPHLARTSVPSALVLMGFVVGAVGIAPPSVAAASVVTATYAYTGAVETFIVPESVTSISITVKGGQGGRGGFDAEGAPMAGGYQGVVAGDVAVSPGDVISIAVGGGGGEGQSSLGSAAGGGGGQNPLDEYDGAVGGVAGYDGSSGGGGGSGAASVLTIGTDEIVAGGAGGNGGNGQYYPIVGRRAEGVHVPRPDLTSTTGQPGLDTASVCQGGCDGGASGAGGGGAQGGEQGQVQYGGDSATEYFGFGGFPGSNSTADLVGLTATYGYYEANSGDGSITIVYDDGAPSAPRHLVGTAGTETVALAWSEPTSTGASAITDYRIEYSTDPQGGFMTFDDGLSTDLSTVITELVNGVTYFFRVSAINGEGAGASAATTIGIVPSDVPEPPTVNDLVPIGGGILVDFVPGWSDSVITGYDYRLDAGEWRTGTVSADRMTIAGLVNGRSYAVQIRARNDIGVSGESTPAQSAAPRDVAQAPAAVLAVAADASIDLTWVAPPADNGAAITDYVIETATAIGGPYDVFVDDVSTATTATVTGLTNGTLYYVRVGAVNAVGIGAWSTAAVATPYTIPDAPSITLTPGDGSLTVDITPAFDGGSAITRYDYRIGTDGPWKPTGALLSTFVIAGLANATSSEVFVRAVNAAGPSDASVSTSATPRTVPAAPAIATVALDTGAISVSFTTGADGGSAVTNVEYSIDDGVNWIARSPSSTQTPVTIDQLVGGVTYPIRLRLQNDAGFSNASNTSMVTATGTPDAPVISLSPGDRALVVSFSTPANGGAPITNYEYSVDDGLWVQRAPASMSSPIVIGGLDNGTAYSLVVRAINAAGSGASSVATLGTPRAVPGAPDLDQQIEDVGGALDVEFTAPTSDGGSPIVGYQYSTDAGATWRDRASGTIASPLHITTLSSDGTTPLTGGTVYRVEIRAVNAVGAGGASSVADGITTTEPDAPIFGSALSRDGSVSITFVIPPNGGAAITEFDYRLDEGVWVNTASLANDFVIDGLVNATPYSLEIRAVNDVGASAPSIAHVVQALTAPAAPAITTITPGDQSLSVAFTAPPSDGGSAVLSYEYSTDGGAMWLTRNTGTTGSPLVIVVSSADLEPLINATSYAVQIRAVNAMGAGDASQTALAVPRGAPAPPTGLTVAPGNGLLVLTFTAGADGGSPITALEYQLDGGQWHDPGSLSSPLTIDGLDNGTSYSIVLRTRNAIGSGTESAPTSGTPRTVPGAPVQVQITPASHEVTVSWVAPAFDGGAPITGYTASLHDQANGGQLVATCSTTVLLACTITGLTNGVTVYADVVAENAAGAGPANASRLTGTPLATPQVVIASIVPGAHELSVLVDVVDGGGAAITTFEYQLGSGSWVAAPTPTSPVTISGLTTGVEYSVRIRAISAGGTGDPSPAVTAVPHLPPSAPTSVGATSADASALLSWTAPASNGGQPITDYTVQYATSALGPYTTFVRTASTATTTTVTGLTNASTYFFRVGAVNTAGTGSWSSLASTTPLGVPGQPTIDLLAAGSGFLQVAFTAPATDGGSPITGYDYRLDAGTWRSGGTTTSPFIIGGLTNGHEYTVQIRAVNIVGDGPASGTAQSTPYGLPGAVLGLRATPSADTATLEWDTVDDNGSPIINYHVIRWSAAIEGGILSTFDTTATSLTVDYFGDGAYYYFTIEAVNAAGTGPRSAPRTSVQFGATVAAAPSDVRTSIDDRAATLTLVEGTDPGSDPVSSYLVQYSTDDTTWTTLSSGPAGVAPTFELPSASTPYSLRVASVSATGVSEFATVRPPLANTGSVTSVDLDSASVAGSVDPNDAVAVAVTFELATSSADLGTPDSTSITASPSTTTGAGSSPVSADLVGLDPGTPYVVRTVVTSDTSVVRGVVRNFATDATIVSSNLSPEYTGSPATFTTVTQPADLVIERAFEGTLGTVYALTSVPPTDVGTYSVTTIPANHAIGGTETVTLTIVAKPLTVQVSVPTRPYDGTTSAPLVLTLDGVIDGDDVQLDAGNVSGAFDDPGAGVDKVVHITTGTGFLTGADTDNYDPDIAAQVLATIDQAEQTLSFTTLSPSPAEVGTLYSPVVVSDMALTVSLSIIEGGGQTCTFSNGTITLLAPGACLISADQDGTTDIAAAVSVEQLIDVVPARVSQTITVEGLHDTPLDAGSLVLPGLTVASMPLTYAASPVSVCTVAASTVSLHGVGTCTVTAYQAGDATHLPATAGGTFLVTPSIQPAVPVSLVVLQVNVGNEVSDSYVSVHGDGYKPFSPIRIELHSEPVLLGTTTTDQDGSFDTVVRLPHVVEAGEHHIVVIGVRPDNARVETSDEFFVDWSGALGDIQTAGGFTPMTATRIIDTRDDDVRVVGGVEFRFVVPAGLVPADASALVLNLTVTNSEGGGYITIYPCGSARPLAAAINFTTGETKANLVDAMFRSGAPMCMWSNVATDVVIDVQGFHSPSGHDRLESRTAVRIVDTRTDQRLEADHVLRVLVGGDGHAAVGTTTVTLNLTVDAPRGAGFLTVFPCDTARPLASNLNFVSGQTVSNEVMVQPSPDGFVCVYSSAETQLIVDLDATYASGASAYFSALIPGRLVDTRSTGKVTAGQPASWTVVGENGAPAGTTALSLNIAVTDPEGAGFLTVYPCESPMPLASNLNFAAGQTISNHVTAAIGPSGRICVFASRSTNVVIDVEGIYRST